MRNTQLNGKTQLSNKVRFAKSEAENVFITMKKYAKMLFEKQDELEITKSNENSGDGAIVSLLNAAARSHTESGSTAKGIVGGALKTAVSETLPLGLFMEAIIRCALIKFGHGT